MTNFYNINPKFYVSVDCIIFGFHEGELNLLLLNANVADEIFMDTVAGPHGPFLPQRYEFAGQTQSAGRRFSAPAGAVNCPIAPAERPRIICFFGAFGLYLLINSY